MQPYSFHYKSQILKKTKFYRRKINDISPFTIKFAISKSLMHYVFD